MKKVLFALLLISSVFVFFGMQTSAAGTGNLVIHYKNWDDNYDGLGSHAWGDTAAGKLKDGVDDFGAYWNYDNIAVGTSVGFIAVTWSGDVGPDWGLKQTEDVNISSDAIIEDKTTHVYVFQGAKTTDDNPAHLIADPDTKNLLVVYYDPAGSYEEDLGMHFWNWNAAGPEWGTPADVFITAGKSVAGFDVKAAMMSDPADDAGLLIYAGTDDDKKTGDVTMTLGGATDPGDVGIAYVVSYGNAYTAGDNVFYNDYAGFADAAFSFKLLSFDNKTKTGTYAVDPNTIVVKTSATIASNYPEAEDKDAARAEIESWFEVREITGTDTYGDPLAIERVDFATTNTTLNQFVIILEDGLDNSKEYEIFFNNQPGEALAVAKEVAVTINVTVPANTPDAAVISAAGAFNEPNAWTPGAAGYIATQVGDTLVYTVTFNVDVTEVFTTFEYKWTRGSWDDDEFIAENRKLIIKNTQDEIEIDDVVEAWKDIDAPEDQYAAPVREVPLKLETSLLVDMDSEAPVIQFINPTNIVGVDPEDRIIEVAWGQPFNQLLFPRFRANDDRDGDLTPFVFVPKGQSSVLDTRTEGDYTIMLRVVDKWGNVTEETFIFRVVKSN